MQYEQKYLIPPPRTGFGLSRARLSHTNRGISTGACRLTDEQTHRHGRWLACLPRNPIPNKLSSSQRASNSVDATGTTPSSSAALLESWVCHPASAFLHVLRFAVLALRAGTRSSFERLYATKAHGANDGQA